MTNYPYFPGGSFILFGDLTPEERERKFPKTHMRKPTYRTKTLSVNDGKKVNISQFANISKTGSVYGMKNIYWGIDALCVICGSYIYNVTSEPSIYEMAH